MIRDGRVAGGDARRRGVNNKRERRSANHKRKERQGRQAGVDGKLESFQCPPDFLKNQRHSIDHILKT